MVACERRWCRVTRLTATLEPSASRGWVEETCETGEGDAEYAGQRERVGGFVVVGGCGKWPDGGPAARWWAAVVTGGRERRRRTE